MKKAIYDTRNFEQERDGLRVCSCRWKYLSTWRFRDWSMKAFFLGFGSLKAGRVQ